MELIKKSGLEIEISRHRLQIERIQPIVNDMLNEGFNFSTTELKDLRDGCKLLYKQAEDMARKDTSRIKALFRRNKDYEDTITHLRGVINSKTSELYTILRSGSLRPLDVGAYEVENGNVILSPAWLNQKEEQYTIQPTDSRIQAEELVQNVKKAIDELNAFVSDNPYFGLGFGSIKDDRRCLCRLTENGEFYIEKENYEYI